MIISEKQILQLILTAKHFVAYMQEKKDFSLYGKLTCKLLDEIREQQSTELKEVK